MTTDNIDPFFFESTTVSSSPELLVAAVLHLMSHYTANTHKAGACVKLASVIERHLKALADLPTLAPVLRATCRQLSEQWASVVEQAIPKQVGNNMFRRILTGR